jgi:hypothetical protein
MEVFRRMIDHLGAAVGPRGRSVSAKRKRLCTSDSATSLHAPHVRLSTSRDSGSLLFCRGPVLLWPAVQASNAVSWRDRVACGRGYPRPMGPAFGDQPSNGWLVRGRLYGPRARRFGIRSHQAVAGRRQAKKPELLSNPNFAGSREELSSCAREPITHHTPLASSFKPPTPNHHPGTPRHPSKSVTHSTVSN